MKIPKQIPCDLCPKILCNTILYDIILYHIISYYIMLYYVHYIILYYIILYYIILYHIISYYTISSLSWQCMSIMLLFSRHSQEKKDRENLRADISENAAGNRKLAKRQRTFSQKIFWKWGIIWKFLWN